MPSPGINKAVKSLLEVNRTWDHGSIDHVVCVINLSCLENLVSLGQGECTLYNLLTKTYEPALIT